jgi:hypothetical protein
MIAVIPSHAIESSLGPRLLVVVGIRHRARVLTTASWVAFPGKPAAVGKSGER